MRMRTINNNERVNNTVSNNSNSTAMRTINNTVTIESNRFGATTFSTVTINSDKTGVTTFNTASKLIYLPESRSAAKVQNIAYSKFRKIAKAIIAERFDENDVLESIIVKKILYYVSFMSGRCGNTIIRNEGLCLSESFWGRANDHNISDADVKAYANQNGISGMSKNDLRDHIEKEIKKYNRDNNRFIEDTILDFFKILGHDTCNEDGGGKYYIKYILPAPQY